MVRNPMGLARSPRQSPVLWPGSRLVVISRGGKSSDKYGQEYPIGPGKCIAATDPSAATLCRLANLKGTSQHHEASLRMRCPQPTYPEIHRDFDCQDRPVVESPPGFWVGRVAMSVGIDGRHNEEDVVGIGSVVWMPDADTPKPDEVCHGRWRNDLWSS